MKKLCFLAMILGLSGCVKISDKPSHENHRENVQSAVREPQVQELPEIEKYQVLLPTGGSFQNVRRKLKSDGGEAQVIPVTIEDQFAKDLQVQSGETYIYEVGSIKNGSFEVAETYEVTVLKDVVIKNEISLQGDEQWSGIRRVHLQEGSVITTNGHHLVIEADQIISEHGLIRSFPKGAEAPERSNGASGGLVEITARIGKGSLRIEMRGQKGGKGKDGDPVPGRDLGTSTGYANDPIRGCSGCAPIGKQGGAAGDGYRGGDSGRAEIEWTELNDMQIDPIATKGDGGNPGIGGDGEPISPYVQTKGPKGRDGNPGPDGEAQRIWVRDSKGSISY